MTSEFQWLSGGQSIGAGFATNLAAQTEPSMSNLALKTLILETLFLSVRAMLETLYPQKWIPYRHLWPEPTRWLEVIRDSRRQN
jgi:hypothetical protein